MDVGIFSFGGITCIYSVIISGVGDGPPRCEGRIYNVAMDSPSYRIVQYPFPPPFPLASWLEPVIIIVADILRIEEEEGTTKLLGGAD